MSFSTSNQCMHPSADVLQPFEVWVEDINLDWSTKNQRLPPLSKLAISNSHMLDTLPTPNDASKPLMLEWDDIVALEIICEPDVRASASSITISSSSSLAKRKRKNSSTSDATDEDDFERKERQRGYERGYRGRIKRKRMDLEHEWFECETVMRHTLNESAGVSTIRVVTVRNDQRPLVDVCKDAVYELRALARENALLTCYEAWIAILDMWGGDSDASRRIRYQINALPAPCAFRSRSFDW